MENVLFSYIILLAGYAALVMLLYKEHVKGYSNLQSVLLNNSNPDLVTRKHLIATALLLATGVIKNSFSQMHPTVTLNIQWWWLVAAVAVLLTLNISLKAVQKEEAIALPRLAALRRNFSYLQVLSYLVFRALFLVAYEFFFRGILLNSLVTDTGIVAGILINIILYVTAHWFADKKEIIGCIPFGAILCFISLASGSIWPAVILHIALSIPYEGSLFLFVKAGSRRNQHYFIKF